MLAMRFNPFVYGSLAALLFLGACAGNKLEVEPIVITDNPTQQIDLLAQGITQGRDQNMDVLSPGLFGAAEASLSKAQKLRDRGGDISKILYAVAEGRAQLKKAGETADVAKLTLPEAIKARDDARAVGATHFEKDYNKAERQFLKLTEAIEENDLEWAKANQNAMVQKFRSLELRAITQNSLGPVISVIERAESEGAKKLAPQALVLAEANLDTARKFVAENRYEKDGIRREAEKARFFADRALQLTQEAARFKEMKPEEIALQIEGMLSDIRGTLPAPDTRNQNLASQAKSIEDSVEALKQDHQLEIKNLRAEQDKLVAKIEAQESESVAKATVQQKEFTERTSAQDIEMAKLREQLASIQGRSEKELEEKRRLEAEIRFNELFMKAQTVFDSNEAEVYKQGEKLLIRLKGIQFPVGQYVIMPDNFTLLSKVQRAVRIFGEPSIVVEGHSDSTGSSDKNKTLSQRRAEAVREYLVANEVVQNDKIKAVGFGSAKPLASNETAEGRALNRRIDLVIQPR
jgi:OmpA-OmpF porin, OOP family